MSGQFFFDFFAVVYKFIADWQQGILLGHQPEGEFTRRVFDQNTDETLHRPERCAVNHHRAVGFVVGTYVFQFKTFGQVVVHLNGTQLPLAANGVAHHEVQFGAVERSFAQLHGGF